MPLGMKYRSPNVIQEYSTGPIKPYYRFSILLKNKIDKI